MSRARVIISHNFFFALSHSFNSLLSHILSFTIQLTMAALWEIAIFALRENLLFATDISILRLVRKPKETSIQSMLQSSFSSGSSPGSGLRNKRTSIVAPAPLELHVGGNNNSNSSSGLSNVPSAYTDVKEEFPAMILVVNLVRAFDLTKVNNMEVSLLSLSLSVSLYFSFNLPLSVY